MISVCVPFQASTIKEFQQFYQGVLKFAERDPAVMSSEDKVHLAKVVQGHYAFLSSSSFRYNMLAAEHCDVSQLPDARMTFVFGFYLQKGSPYTKLVSDE